MIGQDFRPPQRGSRGSSGGDAGKNTLGRKRFLIVDTLGLILGVVVTGADTPERDGGEDVLIDIQGLYHRLEKVWADGGYSGEDFEKVARRLGRAIEVVERNDDRRGFVVLPKRRIVERTFGWLGRYRRLRKDYESRVESGIAMIQIAMTNLMLRRLQPG